MDVKLIILVCMEVFSQRTGIGSNLFSYFRVSVNDGRHRNHHNNDCRAMLNWHRCVIPYTMLLILKTLRNNNRLNHSLFPNSQHDICSIPNIRPTRKLTAFIMETACFPSANKYVNKRTSRSYNVNTYVAYIADHIVAQTNRSLVVFRCMMHTCVWRGSIMLLLPMLS